MGAQEVKGQVSGFGGRDNGKREERKEGIPDQGEEGLRRGRKMRARDEATGGGGRKGLEEAT